MKNFNLLITSMPQKQPTGPQIKMATLLNPKKHLMRKQYQSYANSFNKTK